MSQLCESCRSVPVECAFTDRENEHPYRVCLHCGHRLEHLCLRPLEWFNLAAKHGHARYLLHSDFYDEDGTAHQPEEEIVDANLFPAPTLHEVSHDLRRLIDYAITRWQLNDETSAVLRRFPRQDLLNEVRTRGGEVASAYVLGRCYEICARAVGSTAADWIRDQTGKQPMILFSWAEAAAACLPAEEGFERTLGVIESTICQPLSDWAQALAWFRSERTLDWMETRLSESRLPVTQSWGRLAAVSNLSWLRVQEWLQTGRPLSLVALDALNACWHYDTPLLRRMRPSLKIPPASESALQLLNAYVQQDSVPRVQRAVRNIVTNWNTVIGCA